MNVTVTCISWSSGFALCLKDCLMAEYHYTPGIYAEGYIVFVFPFVYLFISLFVCSFVRSYFRPVCGITLKFYVKVSQVEYISPTTHQKAFIFGP